MSNYNTGNPVPSTDPRDLDDNATNFDELLNSTEASVPDRLGVPRKTWAQMEDDAAALVSPNVAALAAVTAAVDKGVFFNATGPVGMGTYTLTSFNRTLGAAVDAPAFRVLISAMALTDTGAYAGSAASLTTSRSISATGDASWTVNFNGTANATAALTLSTTGVGAGTYGSVTVNAKGLVTAASTVTPVANGGTGRSTAVPKQAFHAASTVGVSQSVTSGVPTKVTLPVEVFDTDNVFDAATNYRFQPTEAGYYQLDAVIRFVAATSGNVTEFAAFYGRNALLGITSGELLRGVETAMTRVGAGSQGSVTALLYMNGTTDYVELWGYVNGSSVGFVNDTSAARCRFQGYLARL